MPELGMEHLDKAPGRDYDGRLKRFGQGDDRVVQNAGDRRIRRGLRKQAHTITDRYDVSEQIEVDGVARDDVGHDEQSLGVEVSVNGEEPLQDIPKAGRA